MVRCAPEPAVIRNAKGTRTMGYGIGGILILILIVLLIVYLVRRV